MEIKIRNLDRGTVLAIDDVARKQGKSRNEYLKEQIELMAVAPKLREQEDRYESIIKELAQIIKQNTEIFERLIE